MNIKSDLEVKESKELELAVAADLAVEDPDVEKAEAILNEKREETKKE